MNYKKLIQATLNHNRNSGMTAIAAIAGLAIGAALSVLFASKSGSETRKLLGSALGLKTPSGSDHQFDIDRSAMEDIREKTREHADQLQGPEKKRKNASLIRVPSAGTDAWKENSIKEERPVWSSHDRI